jgi:phage antirepressor YoqD-like protein
VSNLMNLGNTPLTMSSREIAELVDSRHDSVKRTIERLVAQGVIESPPLVNFKNINNVAGQEYVFSGEQGKRSSIIVVAQLSPEFTARLVDRWQELEAQQAPKVPQTYAQALLEAGRLAQLAEEQAQQLALAAPKVEFVDKFVQASTGSKTFRQVCKLLKVNEREFRAFLEARGVMYRLGGEWVPYAQHLDAGRFEVKAGVAGNDHAYTTTKFTAKGVEWIAGEWGKHQVLQQVAA